MGPKNLFFFECEKKISSFIVPQKHLCPSTVLPVHDLRGPGARRLVFLPLGVILLVLEETLRSSVPPPVQAEVPLRQPPGGSCSLCLQPWDPSSPSKYKQVLNIEPLSESLHPCNFSAAASNCTQLGQHRASFTSFKDLT